MKNFTKKNHYVPRFYLDKFTNKEGFINVKDINTRKVFKSTPKQVGFSNDLYSIKHNAKISDEDLSFIKDFKLFNDDSILYEFIKLLSKYLNNEKIFDISTDNPIINESLKSFYGDAYTNDSSSKQEELFTYYENLFLSSYEAIINNKTISFKQNISDVPPLEYILLSIQSYIYTDLALKLKHQMKIINIDHIPPKLPSNNYTDSAYYNVLFYLCSQLCRTFKSIVETREAIQEIKDKVPEMKFNSTNCTFLQHHIISINLMSNIVNKNYKLVLLKNISTKSFITSDNPVFNVSQNYNYEPFELYFPLTPSLAILCTNQDCYKNIDYCEVSEKDIDIYNKEVLKKSYRYIFATSDNDFNL